MAQFPDADEAMAETATPSAYARHLRQLRAKKKDPAAVAADLRDMNAQAVQNATCMDRAATLLEAVAESEMPMNAMDVDIRPMADVAAAQAEWFDDLAVALKEECERVETEVSA